MQYTKQRFNPKGYPTGLTSIFETLDNDDVDGAIALIGKYRSLMQKELTDCGLNPSDFDFTKLDDASRMLQEGHEDRARDVLTEFDRTLCAAIDARPFLHTGQLKGPKLK